MKCTRFIAFLIVLAGALLLLSSAQAPGKPSDKNQYFAYVGTYTAKTNSKGIYAYRYDAGTGKLEALGVAAETADPSFLVVHPSRKYLYAVNEAGKNSMVSAFALDAANGKLTLLNQLPALGEDPCYISFDRTGKYVFVANYTSGNVVVFPVGADGKLGNATANVHDKGALGPNKERQEAPHAHWIEPGPGNLSVYVADLGLDRILFYGFDPTKGTLSTALPKSDWTRSGKGKDQSVGLVRGTGPRHAAFSKDGAKLYVLGELQSTVTAFQMLGTDMFTPTSIQRISALPKGFSGRNDAAEIAMHPSGRFLYTSNRGNDSIAVFNVQRRGGKLSLAANVPTGGKEPRHFALDPAGSFLLAENQHSDNIVEFRIDPVTGNLAPTGESVSVPSPVCIAFVPLN